MQHIANTNKYGICVYTCQMFVVLSYKELSKLDRLSSVATNSKKKRESIQNGKLMWKISKCTNLMTLRYVGTYKFACKWGSYNWVRIKLWAVLYHTVFYNTVHYCTTVHYGIVLDFAIWVSFTNILQSPQFHISQRRRLYAESNTTRSEWTNVETISKSASTTTD